MKVIQNATPAIASEGLETSVVGFNAQKIQHVSSVLRDMIYSDKRLAPCRELVANATDEHKKHGIKKPVEVSITKEEGSYWLKVRDFAKGLSDHGVRNVWGMYFESTKDESDDLIGGFGVGAKSIFACSDIATITSFHEGIKTVYSAFLDRDESGVGVSKIAGIHSEGTSETGIEVAIPFGQDALSEFNQKIKTVVENCSPDTAISYRDLSGNYYRPIVSKEVFDVSDKIRIHKSEDYRNGVRMGDIVYPFPRFLNIDGLCRNFVVDVPVGYFSLPISREEIADTPQNRKQGEKLSALIEEKRKEYQDNTTFLVKDFCGYGSVERSVFRFNSEDVIGFPVHGLNHQIDNKAKENCVIVIPNNGASIKWKSRLNNVEDKLDKKFNYYRITGDGYISGLLNIHDVHKVVEIKKLGIAKLEGGYGSAVQGSGMDRIYSFRFQKCKYGYSSGVTKDSFSLNTFLSSVPDRTPKDCQSIKELKEICVLTDTTTDTNEIYHVCKSARDQLVKTGKVWNWADPALDEIKTKLTKKDKERREEEEQIKNIQSSVGLYSERTIKIVAKNPDHPRVHQLIKAVKKAKQNPLIADVINKANVDQQWRCMKRIHLREIMRKMG